MGIVYFSNSFKDCEEHFDFIGRVNFPDGVDNKSFIRQWLEELCDGAVYIDTRSDYSSDKNDQLCVTTSYFFENKNDLLKFKVAFGGKS